MGKQITIEQLIEKLIVMTISKPMIMNIDIMSIVEYPRPHMGPGGPLLVRWGGASCCTKSRSAHDSTAESTQAIYLGLGRCEA